MLRRLGSVRLRTTLAATLALGVALAFGGVALVLILQRSLTAEVQRSLESLSGDIAAQAMSGTAGITLPDERTALVEVVGSAGRVVAASSGLRGRPPVGPFHVPGDRIRPWSQRLTSDDELYRIVGTATATPSGPVTIYVASSLEVPTDTVTKVKGELAVGLPLLALVVAATCWLMVGRALRPVEAIRAQVAEIGSRALDRRVPEPAVRDEVGRLARTMNAMLDRLQSASERQRRFVADASHELRSPLASLRTQIEVRHEYPVHEEGTEAVANELAEVHRMERLVSDLLLLARADERTLVSRSALVPLDQVILKEVTRSSVAGRPRIDTAGVRPGTVPGDRDALARAVRNLLENAERHAVTRVEVALRPMDGHIRMTVSDDGPGIPLEERDRVFERFTRLDEGRARDDGGAGLGLAIVREIVATHGGRIDIADGGSGACFVVDLPAAGTPDAPRD